MKKTIDLSKTLKENKRKGWVAVDKNNKIIVEAATFKSICKKVENFKEDLTLLPSSKNYFGFIT